MSGLSKEVLWNETLTQMKAELGEEEYDIWFTDVCCLRSGENSITIGFPSAFHRDRVKKSYQTKIRSKLTELAGTEIALEFALVEKGKEEAPTQKPVKNISVETKESERAKAPNEAFIPSLEKPKREKHPDLRDDFTFERYVVGGNNDFAANAANAISRNPGTSYNPFLIYGGAGMGKTHLMQAIGNYIHENSDKKVLYVTSEDFLNEFTEGIRTNKMTSFKNKFRRVDVLLIDDIQFFAERYGVQDELFHTFNTVINARNQIVFTCDRPPSELKKFEARLVSRFDQGLTVDLQPPKYEVRFAILKSAAEDKGASIPDDVLELVSKKISSNVRDLIGALNNLIAYAQIMGEQVTLEIAQQRLKDVLVSNKQSNLSIETIQKIIANHFSISVNDLKGKKRKQNIVYPRQLAMFICREMTEYSSTEIGEAFGGKDHSTVIYSIDKIRNRSIVDASIDLTIETLKRQIKESVSKM